MITDDLVAEAIKTVYDPEIPINVYDLGLIYLIEIEDERNVKINMTLTSANCPFAQQIPVEVREKVLQIDGVEEVTVKLVWDPIWGEEHMSGAARLELGLL